MISLRYIWFILIIRPLVLLLLGVNVRHREKLPESGPAIIVANHNSHLDTMVLITLLPIRLLRNIRPVASMEYFLSNRLLAWFALKIVGIIPLKRRALRVKEDPLASCSKALEEGDILILFPEGTRGKPEKLHSFKTGVAHLAKRFADVPVTPVFMHGLGKTLPRGEALLVPFFCDVFVGEPLYWNGDRGGFMEELNTSMKALEAEGNFAQWD